MAQNRNTRTRPDRFGQQYAVVGCKDKKDTGFPVGYITIGGKTYKLEPSPANKEGVSMWIRVTKVNSNRSGGTF